MKYRIYVKQAGNHLAQAGAFDTNLYYDVDPDRSVSREGEKWYRVVSAGPRADRLLYRQDTEEEGMTKVLGARMRLVQNKWWVAAADVSLEKAAEVPEPPLSRLEALILAGMIVVVIYFYIGKVNGWNIKPVAAVTGVIGTIMIGWDVLLHWWRKLRRR